MFEVFTYYYYFFSIFLLKIQNVVVIQRSHVAVATHSQLDFKIGIRLVAVPLATATATNGYTFKDPAQTLCVLRNLSTDQNY